MGYTEAATERGRGPPVELALSVVEGVEPEPLLVYADNQVIEYQEAYYIPEYL